MFKNALIFGIGALFGAYVYRNHLRAIALEKILRFEEHKTSKTKKDS